MEFPMTNDKVPRKFQFPSPNTARCGAAGWDLELGISLEVGHWELGIRDGNIDSRLITEH